MSDIKAAKIRSNALSERIRQRTDQAMLRLIQQYSGELIFYPLSDLMISDGAWEYVNRSDIEPKLVFAHPNMLSAHPETSQYYRGIALLSQKRAGAQVAKWEDGSQKKPPSRQSCVKVSRLYNAVISSIIEGASDWTLENGYRNIVATMGIRLDGFFRNKIGQDAEELIKTRIAKWLQDRHLVSGVLGDNVYELPKKTVMRFGSEPDIAFMRDDERIATIEIKGGKDPAGALERLGAMQKSFAETPPSCVNFLIAGVVTKEMEKRLKEIGRVKVFVLDDITDNENKWKAFMREVFHHAVRII